MSNKRKEGKGEKRGARRKEKREESAGHGQQNGLL